MEEIFSLGINIIILLAFSAFFSVSETSLLSLNKSQLIRMAHGNAVERVIHSLLQAPKRLLATILVGNMFVNVLLTALCATLLSLVCMGRGQTPGLYDLIFVPFLKFMGVTLSPAGWESTAEVFGAVMNIAIVTPMLLLFGELTPKTVAMANPGTCARISALPIKYLGRILAPLLWCLDKICTALQRLFHLPDDNGEGMLLHRSDIQAVLRSEGATSASQSERNLLQRILELDNRRVKNLMAPIDAFCVESGLSVREAYETARRQNMDFVLVKDPAENSIRGYLAFSDYPLWCRGEHAGTPLAAFLHDAVNPSPIYPVFTVDGERNVATIISDMHQNFWKIAIVTDEAGNPAGVITLHSVIDAIARHTPSINASETMSCSA